MLVFLTLGGCVGQYRNHGYLPPEELINALQIGKETKKEIVAKLGAPATGLALKDNTFYYVRTRIHNRGYLGPKENSREVLALSFDKSGVLRNVERFGLEKGQLIVLEHKITEGVRSNQNIVRQIFSSIGGPSAEGIFDNN